MLERLSGDGNVRGLRGDTLSRAQQPPNEGRAFLEEAVVVEVYDRGGAAVHFRGRIVQASQATDEPLRAGSLVYLSEVKGGGFLIHGTVK